MIHKIILFSHYLGQLNKGVSQTPNYLEHFIDNKNIQKVPISNDLYQNLDNLYTMNSITKNPIINIGGDHSMAIATVADSLNKFENLKVVWIDAHPDINTMDSSISKNMHGMPLSFLTGLDTSTHFSFIKNTLSFDNLLYIGIRDIDDFEKNIIDKYDIKYLTVDDIKNKPIDSLETINTFIKECPIHLSFDVDSIDPGYIPCTGTTVTNGLDILSTKKVIDTILQNIVSVDITELNLEIGTNNDKFKSLSYILFLFKTVL